MRGHNVMMIGVCGLYGALVRPAEQYRDQRIADAWRDFDIRMTIAARKAHEIGDWRAHEREWTVAQADRAERCNAAWKEYDTVTARTNKWFQDRLNRACPGRNVR
jgi:hypothetical protein